MIKRRQRLSDVQRMLPMGMEAPWVFWEAPEGAGGIRQSLSLKQKERMKRNKRFSWYRVP